MKRTIRLTENDLHRVIKESVKRILSERIKSEKGMNDKDVVNRRMKNYLDDRNKMLGDNPDILDYQAEPEEGWYEYFNNQRKAKHNATQNHNANDVDEYQNFDNNSSNDEIFNDAVEAIEMSDGMIDFYEWYPAFQDYVEPDEAEEVFNRALRKCGYLNENKLNRVIKESVKTILNENYEHGTYVVVDENTLGYVVKKGNNNSLRVNVVAVDPFADIHGYAKYGAEPNMLNKQILALNGHYRKATFEDGERFNVRL